MSLLEKSINTILAYTEKLEEYKDKYNVFYNELHNCYNIVENFIKRNNKILVGGMAIDFALKIKGSYLYSKNKIDYDFISHNYHVDAYNLGNKLAEKFDNISVIGALHVSTMRVRYNFMPVADITYVPKILYDRIKIIEYEGFKCVHPHYQMIDQMRSLVYMAENPPRESFLSDRLEKDVKRYTLLHDFYPIDKIKNKKIVKRLIPYSILQNNCIGGFLALAYWTKILKLPLDLNINTIIKGGKNKKQLESLNINETDNKYIEFNIPSDSKITIYSNDPDQLIKLIIIVIN